METTDERARAARIVNARIAFLIHLAAYLVVNGLLITINLLTSTHYLWFVWALVGWGAGLAAHGLVTLFLSHGMTLRDRMIARELEKRVPPA